jgi:hypothetical protein
VLHDPLGAVQLGQEQSRHELNCDPLVLERTLEQGDDGGAARAVLSVGGISYPRKVSSVLDQHVLKATSSANQRDVPLPRLSHDGVGCLRIAVWAAGPNDDGRSSSGDPRGVTNRVRGHDPHLDGNPSML